MGGLTNNPGQNQEFSKPESIFGKFLKDIEASKEVKKTERSSVSEDVVEELVIVEDGLEPIENGVQAGYELGKTQNKKIEKVLNMIPDWLGGAKGMYVLHVEAGADSTGFSFADFNLDKASRLFRDVQLVEDLMPVFDEDSQKWAQEVMNSKEWLEVQDFMKDGKISQEELSSFKISFPKTFSDPRGILNFLTTVGRAQSKSEYVNRLLSDLYAQGKITSVPDTKISLILGEKKNDRNARFTRVRLQKKDEEALKILKKMSVPAELIDDQNK